MLEQPTHDLFRFIMEADGDELDAFQPDTAETPAQASSDNTMEPSPAGDEDLVGAPPTSDDMDDMDMGSDDTMMSGDTGDETDSEEEDQKDDESTSQKASNILNQRLYKQFIDRNTEIETILKNIDQLQPVLPYDVSKAIIPFITDLKTTLAKSQSYVINKFVDTAYGENVLYYEKINALYTALLDSIDSNLKKVDTDEV